MRDPLAHPVLLRTALLHAGRVLDQLGRKGHALEEAVGDAIQDGPAGRVKLRRALQGLDHVVQSINDMARFLEALSRQTRMDELVDLEPALRHVLQRDLMVALLAGFPHQEPALDPGEVDFL